MSDLAKIEALLVEIREILRGYAQLANNQSEVTQQELARSAAQQEQSLKNQEIALRTQRANARLYRIVVSIAALTLILCLLALASR